MITSTIALFAALTLVGPTSKVNGAYYQCDGIHPDLQPQYFRTPPTSDFHSKMIELGSDIYRFTNYWGPAGWTNLTVISSSDKFEQHVREHDIQGAVWCSIKRIAGEAQKHLDYVCFKEGPIDEYTRKMRKYGEDHMYIYESLRYQADLLMGLDVIDETIPPWSGTPEEQAARDELFTIIETWAPYFHRKVWKKDQSVTQGKPSDGSSSRR